MGRPQSHMTWEIWVSFSLEHVETRLRMVIEVYIMKVLQWILFIWVQGSIKCKHNSITVVFLSIYLPNASKFIDTNFSWEYYNITELWFAFIHHPFISFCLHLIICLYHESMIIIIYLITSFFMFCFLSHFFLIYHFIFKYHATFVNHPQERNLHKQYCLFSNPFCVLSCIILFI